jgi:hypothetical protein
MLGLHPDVDENLSSAVDNISTALNKSAFMGDRLITFDKSVAFMEDPKFLGALERCAVSDEERGRVWRIHTLIWAARNAIGLDGDFVECGVFEGFMSAMVADYMDFETLNKTFYLYDTFEGFSEKYSSPADFPGQESFYQFANTEYGKPGLFEGVTDRFEKYDNVKVIKGVVPDILHEDSPQKIAYLHIDLNSPRAERGALDVLYDRVLPGGIIIFDDYGWSTYRKQMDSADAFMAEHGYPILELPTGQGLMVKR